MDASNVNEPTWRKSTTCAGANCVWVANMPHGVGIRGSEDGPVLVFTHEEWREFLAGATRGEFGSSE